VRQIISLAIVNARLAFACSFASDLFRSDNFKLIFKISSRREMKIVGPEGVKMYKRARETLAKRALRGQ
jgi:hypothetical protein